MKAAIAEAGLSEPLTKLVRRVVQKTRLWRSEKVDVAGELIAHFADGLAAGQSPETLVDSFGDARQAARLIRRAKRRNRPLFWRFWGGAVRTAGWTAAALVVFYVAVLIRFLTGRPTIAFNYTAQLNAAAQAVPEHDRAWPLYREALLKLQPVPEDITAEEIGVGTEPGSPNIWAFLRVTPDKAKAWESLSEYIKRNQESVDLIRQAAARPHLGFWYGNPADSVAFPADPNRKYLVPLMDSENPMVITINLENVQYLCLLALLLRADSRLGVEERDGDRVVGDLVAQLGICGHCDNAGRFLVSDLIGFAVLRYAFSTLGETLVGAPETFSDAQLQQLAHTVAAVGDGGPLDIHLEGERLFSGTSCSECTPTTATAEDT